MRVWELVSLLASLEDQDADVVVWSSAHKGYVLAAGVKAAEGMVEVTASDLENMS